jgi:antitoxin MazE
MSVVKAKVVRIGNSKGIRIPKTILEQCNINDEVELETRDDCLIIKSPHSVREGWEIEFKKMRKNEDDVMFVKEDVSAEWDEEEWEW